MSLEIHTFPKQMIDVVTAIPEYYALPGEYANLASYLQTLELPKPTFIENAPVVVRLDDSQRNIFDSSLSDPTPAHVPSIDSQPVSRFGLLQLALGSSIGNLLSIPDVRNGALVQDIFPKESSRVVASSSYGSDVEFAFHNDLSFLDEQDIPDFVTLGCIRNNEGVATLVASFEDILTGLDKKNIAELQKTQYDVRHTYNRGLSNERVGIKQSAVLLPDGEICLGVDMTPQTPEARVALQSLRKHLKRISTPYRLEPGQVLVLPNKHTVHARDAFTMSSDINSRRWLQRINIGSKIEQRKN